MPGIKAGTEKWNKDAVVDSVGVAVLKDDRAEKIVDVVRQIEHLIINRRPGS